MIHVMHLELSIINVISVNYLHLYEKFYHDLDIIKVNQ